MHSKQRYLFIDLLRFLAVVFMVQGHTFDALLDFELRSNTLFFVHDFFHGFIAPMFLFASGTAFGISTFKKWQEHVSVTQHVWRRIGKFLGLLLIGYALHLPYFSLQKILTVATEGEIATWQQVDALHCIAATLLILQLSILVLKTEKRFIWCVGTGAVAVIFLSPIVWSIDFKQMFPLWLVSYLNSGNNSWFPLFPWSAYLLCGVIFSWLFINAKEHRQAMKLMQHAVVIGVLAFTLSLVVVNLPFNIYPHHDVWKVNPLIIVARLGFVAVITSAVFFAEHTVKIKSQIPQIMGRESLFIYVLHLVILYGSVVNKGLQQIILPTLSVVQSTLYFILIFGGITVFTYGWYHFKTNYKRSARAMKFATAGIFIVLFLVRPY
ncbi:MAG: heparan-alpha-glucosaminide N-acetyltransferase domain-containing protein [Bacteroidota bacterium]